MSKTYTIAVDIGYVFDMISIYDVKRARAPSDQSRLNYYNAVDHLLPQIGEGLLFTVLRSFEYKHLYRVNDELFTLVDLAKTDLVKASEVDAGVYRRFLAKRALQERFFPESAKIEQKIGYIQ